jgi:hypothetical protein
MIKGYLDKGAQVVFWLDFDRNMFLVRTPEGWKLQGEWYHIADHSSAEKLADQFVAYGWEVLE